jgi:hypothetical protein
VKVIERSFGPPRSRTERVLVADNEVNGLLALSGRHESVRAVELDSLPADLQHAVKVLAKCGQGHIDWD